MIGRTYLGRYEATRLLGEGGMGRVYLARQVDLPDRQLVIKVMHEQIVADIRFRERFRQEVDNMGKFQHPYAVTLHDFSFDDPQGPCIVMEYVRGVNLDTLLHRNGRFSPARVGRLLGQMCEVLEAAHARGIIHRDMKPANIMVVDPDTPRERIKVMDFGLAKIIDSPGVAKIVDHNFDFAVGTPAYICPEQLRDGTMDHRGDIYSVGVMLFELLTGRLPFLGATQEEMLYANALEKPPTFAEAGAGDWAPQAVETVVQRCLAKDPNERPQSAQDLASEYEAALASASSRVSTPPRRTNGDLSPDKAFQPTYIAPPDDPNAILFTLEAWMPTSVALVKLRGYVQDSRGEVLESIPGKVRVRLPAGQNAVASKGRLSWLGLGRKPGPIIVELHLQQTEGRHSHLHIDARFRPGDSTPATDAGWRARCVAHYINLRGYLIGKSEFC